MEILAIIPARGGSKTIPKKNIKPLLGRPLIGYTFDSAKKSKLITRIILTTDDEEIGNLGRKNSVEVPFLRPKELAEDTTPTLPVLIHAINFLKNKENYYPDYIILLQPTVPLRTENHIDEALKILIKSKKDSIVSVTEIPSHFNPQWQLDIQDNKLVFFLNKEKSLGKIITRKQDLPKTYYRNGAIYAFPTKTLMEKNSLYGDECVPYIMPEESSVNIDTLKEFLIAELILKNRKK